MKSFSKHFLFILIIVAIFAAGVLIIKSATPSGSIKIQTGRHSDWTAPVAWWKMNEASWSSTTGEVIDSIGTNHGIGINGANNTSTAVFGRAGSFDGSNDYVSVSDISAIENADVSFSFWVKVNSNTKDHDFITKGYHATNNPLVIWYDDVVGAADKGADNTDTLSVLTYDGSVQHWVAGTSGALNNTNWNYITIIIDNTNNQILIYINGQLNQSNTKSWNGIRNTSDIILFGIDKNLSSTIFLNGFLDDVRVYNYALTANQVRQIYNETAKLKANPILGHDLDLNALYYAQAANSTVHDITTQDISISAWVKVDVDAGSMGWMVDKSGSYNFGYIFYYYGGVLKTIVTGANPYQSFSMTGGINLRDNKWHHVSAIIDRDNQSNCKLFVDGSYVSLTTSGDITTVGSLTTSYTFRMGGSNNFDGQIRDVKLYYAAGDHWTDAQVLYQAQHPFDYSSNACTLTDYWRCDEGSGTTVNGKPSTGYSLTLSSALAWTTQPKVKASTGLVGYWKMDENDATAVARDYSGKGNNGTTTSGTATSTSVFSTTTAQIGRAMYFDGVDDYVNLGNFNTFPGAATDKFTISLWLEGSNLVKTTAYDFFGIGSNDTGRLRTLGHRSSNNQMTFVGYAANAFSDTLSDGSWSGWNYWVITYDNGIVNFYRNGVNVGLNKTLSSSLNNLATYQAYIGKSSFNLGMGLIDEVKIYNYARSAEQILQDYQRGLKGEP